jgi:ABC-type microcin C transport system permease subunit YejB
MQRINEWLWRIAVPLLAAVVGDFLGREDAFPFQATATKVEKQDYFAIRCSKVINTLGYLVVVERLKMGFVFDQ